MSAASRKRVTAEEKAHNVFTAWAETTRYPSLAAYTRTGIVLVNGANERAHWALRMKRAEAQIRDVSNVAMSITRSRPPLLAGIQGFGAAVLIVRSCRRRFDSDNLVISGKHVRDSLSKFFGHHDGDVSFWSWTHDQVLGEPGTLIAIGVKAPHQPHLVVGVYRGGTAT